MGDETLVLGRGALFTPRRHNGIEKLADDCMRSDLAGIRAVSGFGWALSNYSVEIWRLTLTKGGIVAIPDSWILQNLNGIRMSVRFIGLCIIRNLLRGP